ncbi:MAG TPA: GNAT family N-acetyltransferase [Gemmatimonadales bacterium]|nr:GNAT family N-acetyltransferase [Gemmatimonadales bacterium]
MPKRGAGRTRIREVLATRDPAFRPAHRLLAASLPAGEVVSIREWRHTLAERSAGVWTDQCWHLLVAERGGRVLGMTSGTYLGSHNVGMIGYLVLHPSLRKQGIGPRLRNRLRTCFERDARATRGEPLTAIVGEVDAANPWLLNLMRRAGALALDFPYYQPSLRAEDPPSPLVLYYQPLTRPRRFLPVDEVRRLIYAIWRRLYRIAKPLQRPAFRLMLRSLRGRRRVAGRAGI